MTTYQTAILLAFNHREHMSVKEMQDHTDLDTKEVHKVRITFWDSWDKGLTALFSNWGRW